MYRYNLLAVGLSKSTFLRAYGALTFFSARLRRADKSIVPGLGLRPSRGSVRRNPVRANIEIWRIHARATTNHLSRCERPKYVAVYSVISITTF